MKHLHFQQLFTGGEWLDNVRLDVADDGTVFSVTADASADECEVFAGCALPGMPNLHSHAHQRAMAGLAERSGARGNDSFWTWRRLMYQFVDTMGPEDLEAIAAQLYVEMLEAGYTMVGEFQYLHHDPDGRPYLDPAEMTLRCLAAARRTGIGFTALPVFYAQGGFDRQACGEGQRRFVHRVDDFLRLVERLRGEIRPEEGAVGIAPHSLRAVSPEQLSELVSSFAGQGPIHIHVAEQRKEVQDCLAWSGQRPVAWLLDHAPVDSAWCLIHCTHLEAEEVRDLASSGAVAGLCPTTEANLGDGIFSAGEFLARGGRIGIGSDSHISTSPIEELRWLEYGQRLLHEQRNALAGGAEASTGRRLVEAVLASGAQASGRRLGLIEPGYRADLVVLDTDHPLLAARRTDEVLDSWIFSGNDNTVRDVLVGGRHVVRQGRHADRESIAHRFRETLNKLRKHP